MDAKNTDKYICEICEFKCGKQSNFLKHESTKKHLKNKGIQSDKALPKFLCGKCNKEYKCNIVMPAPVGSVKKTKKLIPLTLKRKVWEQQIGEDIGKTKCLCCRLTDITQMSFHCGHIISESNGGEIKLDNLRPICQSCNSSMGTVNMDEFISKYGLTAKEVVV
jgi:hypothetical protein